MVHQPPLLLLCLIYLVARNMIAEGVSAATPALVWGLG